MTTTTFLTERQRATVLAGLSLLLRDLKQGGSPNPVAPILANDGDHVEPLGLAAVDELASLVAAGALIHNPHSRALLEFPTPVPGPHVSAEAWIDGGIMKVPFDAARWFSTASEDAVLDLALAGWCFSGDSCYILQECSDWVPELAELFTVMDIIEGHPADQFEGTLNEGEAKAWLKVNRRGLWARVLCRENGIFLAWPGENEGEGDPIWFHDDSEETSDEVFDSVEAAALAAVSHFGLDTEKAAA